MKYSAVACATLIAAVAAQPHYSGSGTSKRANKHAHNNHKHVRNNVNVPRAVVTVNEVVTETVYVTEMIDETTTVWITPGQEAKATPTSAAAPNKAPGNFYETPSAAAAPPPPAPEAPKPSPSPSSQAAAPPPPPAPTTSTSVYVAPPPAAAPSTTSVNVPSPNVDVAPPPPPPVSKPQTSSAPSTGGGGPGSGKITGDFTWYDIGMGSCGEDDKGRDMTECIVAVSHIRMGQQSNGNPMCGKTISMSANGKTITGTVKDKCMGCAANDIDVSKACFTQLFDLGVGRTTIEWWFN
ncbi:riboflavin aldehyde-forming enzyme [Metarhizium guizhouense ARSEF 977]|uniref:Riboflavin aldehyde-forming enzyme n=1 Tax=Metarhizium guizhouense (strain ARSEF 977) TaxID=1276136 RepID=A0A0B4H740_METGA|nr:riboflavin aldehyde-forming enzyme [Metarhizium guizhouense ARSEF 977]